MSRWRALPALAWGLVAAPGLASASPAYSTALAQRAGAPAEPACGVCHAVAPDLDPAAMAPFGQALRDRGFNDGSNLVAAFDQMALEKVDSDGDKSLDTDELGWGGDPNGYEGVRGDPAPEIKQGFCGVARALGAPGAPPAALVALALAGLRRRRARRLALEAGRRSNRAPAGPSASRAPHARGVPRRADGALTATTSLVAS